MRTLTLVTTLAALVCGALGDERDSRFFDGPFFRDRGNLPMRRDTLQDTMDQISSTFNTAIDRLSDAIEEQVEASLPVRLRNGGEAKEGVENLGGLEAISGTFGEGIDDGLRTHFNGDLEGESVDGPRFEEPTHVSAEEDAEFTEDVDNTPTYSYRPFFPFDTLNPFGNPWRRPGTGLFDFMNRRPAWWKGPNVCVEREEIDEGKDLDSSIKEGGETTASGSTLVFTVGNMQVTSCAETRDRYTCTSRISRRGIHKTVVVTHKCCHGYVREGAGCSRIELRSMAETLEDIGSNDFLTLVKRAGMTDMLDQNITLFVPTNEAMQEFMVDLEAENELENELVGDRSANEVYPILRAPIEEKSMVMAHGTDGVLYASDLRDEQVLPSLMDGSTLRINTYSTVPPAATVNCARMVSVNQHSTHGVVHSIDKVLQPITKSLAELLVSDPRFSILYRLVENAGLLDKLREPGQLTLFAPTDAAFRTLSAPVVEALLANDACVDAIVKNHILPNVICTAAVQGKARTINLLEEFLMLERTEEDDLFVEDDVQVLARDIMGTNGVMHVIDKPVMPSAAKNVVEVIRDHNLTRFLDMLEAAEMLSELTGLKDVTIFAPSNRAIDTLPKGVLDDLMSDKDKLRNLLNYHITTSSLKASDIANNHIADTRADLPLRVNLYSRTPLLAELVRETGNRYVRLTAGCSRISTLDSRACGAVVHVVERLLAPPKATVMHHLEDDEDFTIFTNMLHDTGVNETLVEQGPFTVLAPSDHVFNALPEMELQHLLSNAELQERLVKQHIIKEHVCCAGINPNTWLFMDHKRPLDGSSVHIRRTISGRIMAGPARITHCSPPSRNGLVHTVNHLLLDVNPNSRVDRTRRPIFSAPGLEIIFG